MQEWSGDGGRGARVVTESVTTVPKKKVLGKMVGFEYREVVVHKTIMRALMILTFAMLAAPSHFALSYVRLSE